MDNYDKIGIYIVLIITINVMIVLCSLMWAITFHDKNVNDHEANMADKGYSQIVIPGTSRKIWTKTS